MTWQFFAMVFGVVAVCLLTSGALAWFFGPGAALIGVFGALGFLIWILALIADGMSR